VTTSIAVVAVVVSIYTIVGGLRAVVVTETVNTVFLLLGAVIITLYAMHALPAHGIHSIAEFRAATRPNQLSMLQRHSAAGLNWYAVFLGYPVLGVWYWCTDQTIVQRVLGARSERDAQLGPLLAGFLKILPVFLLVLPGVIAYVLFHDIIGSNSNQTLPVLINELVPTGLKGLISAAVLAALFSAVSAALNSSGTLVAVDIVKRIRPETSDRGLVQIGRISSTVVMILAVLWSTQGGRFSSIFEAINVIAADLAPPITAVFVMGVFWRRGTKEASIITMITGFIIGAISFVLDLPVFGSEKLITQGLGISFMMQAWWVFCLCTLLFVVVSLLTPPPAPEQIEGLTWEHPFSVIFGKKLEGLSDPRVVAGLLMATMVVLYCIFR
jgi:SSS family solute:Na+ symporter